MKKNTEPVGYAEEILLAIYHMSEGSLFSFVYSDVDYKMVEGNMENVLRDAKLITMGGRISEKGKRILKSNY